MRKFFYLFFLFSTLASAQFNLKYLKGRHWTGHYNVPADTIKFLAHKKYDPSFYQWGGASEGWEFLNDSLMQIYYNVLCSSESSPRDLFPSKWKIYGDTLELKGSGVRERFVLVKLTKRAMLLKAVFPK